MKRVFPLIFICLLGISCSTNGENINENGFDTACNIFKEALPKELPHEELGKCIEDKLNAMPDQNAKRDVIELYDVIFQPAPHYDIYFLKNPRN